MELTGDTNPEAVRVYQSPTPYEQREMQFGRCILLRHFVGAVPMSIAQSRPNSCELYGLINGRLKDYDIAQYPEILTGQLADMVYFHRVEAAAERIGSVLSAL